MNLILDAGALIAVDRNDLEVAGLIKLARRVGATLITSAPVVGQAWREGSRQALLARSLATIEVLPVDEQAARRAGELLAATGTADIVDALLAMLVAPGDQLLTSDPGDLSTLLDARNVRATIVRV